MEKKSKCEQFLILLGIAVLSLVLLCLTGCGGSCFGCGTGCKKEDAGCLSGCSYMSDGCFSEDSCYYTMDCVKEEPRAKGSNKVLLLSCETASDGCLGESGCYDGCAYGGCGGCGACGTCAVFCGTTEGEDEEHEYVFGCVDGCAACGREDARWRDLLQYIYHSLGME